MLVGGAGLRVVAFLDRKSRYLHESLPLQVHAPVSVSQFSRMSREDYLNEQVIQADQRLQGVNGEKIVWPVLIFFGIILVPLVLDDALWQLFESALALYGPIAALLGAYVLLMSAVRGVRFIGSQFK